MVAYKERYKEVKKLIEAFRIKHNSHQLQMHKLLFPGFVGDISTPSRELLQYILDKYDIDQEFIGGDLDTLIGLIPEDRLLVLFYNSCVRCIKSKDGLTVAPPVIRANIGIIYRLLLQHFLLPEKRITLSNIGKRVWIPLDIEIHGDKPVSQTRYPSSIREPIEVTYHDTVKSISHDIVNQANIVGYRGYGSPKMMSFDLIKYDAYHLYAPMSKFLAICDTAEIDAGQALSLLEEHANKEWFCFHGLRADDPEVILLVYPAETVQFLMPFTEHVMAGYIGDGYMGVVLNPSRKSIPSELFKNIETFIQDNFSQRNQ